MPETKYHALARKLKALAEQGVGGEKDNAEEALRKLLEKHNISFHEIEDEAREDCFFTYRAGENELLTQICWQVIGPKAKIYQWGAERERKLKVKQITAAQRMEILAKHQFYKRLLLEEFEVLKTAFLYKHNIFPADDDEEEPEEPLRIGDAPAKSKKELEREQKERDRHRRAARMADGLKDAPFLKQIDPKK